MLPATGDRDVARFAPEPAVLPFGSPACVVATPPPPHRSALEACRPSRTLGPALCTALVPSLPRPARRRVDPSIRDGAGGIRTHGLELMKLARTATPLPRDAPRGDGSGRQDSNLRSPTPEVGGVARLPYDQPWCEVERPVHVPVGAGGRLCRPGGHGRATCARARRRGLVGEPWVPPRWIDDRGIEPRSTAVSERRLPSRPVVGTSLKASASPPQLPRCRISPGGFEPPTPTVAGWRSVPLSYGESSALGGSRTRLTRETAEPRHQARPRACAATRSRGRAPRGRCGPDRGTPSGILAIEIAGAVLDLR